MEEHNSNCCASMIPLSCSCVYIHDQKNALQKLDQFRLTMRDVLQSTPKRSPVFVLCHPPHHTMHPPPNCVMNVSL